MRLLGRRGETDIAALGDEARAMCMSGVRCGARNLIEACTFPGVSLPIYKPAREGSLLSGQHLFACLDRNASRRYLIPIGLVMSLCGGSHAAATTAQAGFPTPAASVSEVDYRIGSLDKLNIAVFQVKALTIDKVQVDGSGQILLPLIGAVMARGKTTTELSAEIARRLAGQYMQSPQVSVTVDEAVSQKISVEGAVNEAGVFELRGRTSLLEAVAKAKGVAKGANLHKVTIIRNVDGTPHAGVFDLAAIGAGRAGNPEVVGNDVVIVDESRSKSIFHGIVEVLPFLYVFTLF